MLALFAVLGAGCSERRDAALVDRVLPVQTELPGNWGGQQDDYITGQDGSPSDDTDTAACHELDPFHEDQGDRSARRRIFRSNDVAGLQVGFLSEVVPEGWSAARGAKWVADYYRSAAFGRCFADDASASANERYVAETPVSPSITQTGVEGVAWLYELEGEATVLRQEIYVWYIDRLVLSVIMFVPDGEVEPDVVKGLIEAFQHRSASELARNSGP